MEDRKKQFWENYALCFKVKQYPRFFFHMVSSFRNCFVKEAERFGFINLKEITHFSNHSWVSRDSIPPVTFPITARKTLYKKGSKFWSSDTCTL